jgi:hypothetical protein
MSLQKGHDFAMPLFYYCNTMQWHYKKSRRIEIIIDGLQIYDEQQTIKIPLNHIEDIFMNLKYKNIKKLK